MVGIAVRPIPPLCGPACRCGCRTTCMAADQKTQPFGIGRARPKRPVAIEGSTTGHGWRRVRVAGPARKKAAPQPIARRKRHESRSRQGSEGRGEQGRRAGRGRRRDRRQGHDLRRRLRQAGARRGRRDDARHRRVDRLDDQGDHRRRGHAARRARQALARSAGQAVVPELGEVRVLEGFDADGKPKTRKPKRDITLRHLLTHTAGFGYEIWNADIGKYRRRWTCRASPAARTRR